MNKYTHKSIPVIEYRLDKPKRLIFINHGIYGSKEKIIHLLGPLLNKLGYHVVAVDAAKHGSRKEEPYASKDTALANLRIFDVVQATANDIVCLYEDNYMNDYTEFDVLGVSMGGYTAYYLTLIIDHIATVVALISSPNFTAANVTAYADEIENITQDELNRIRESVQSMDPALHAYEMKVKKIIALNGLNDVVVPVKHTTEFFQNNPNFTYVHEQFETGHKMTRKMTERLMEELKKTI